MTHSNFSARVLKPTLGAVFAPDQQVRVKLFPPFVGRVHCLASLSTPEETVYNVVAPADWCSAAKRGPIVTVAGRDLETVDDHMESCETDRELAQHLDLTVVGVKLLRSAGFLSAYVAASDRSDAAQFRGDHERAWAEGQRAADLWGRAAAAA